MAFIEFKRGSHVDPDSVILIDIDERVKPYEVKVRLVDGTEKICGTYTNLAVARRQARNIARTLNDDDVEVEFEPEKPDDDKVIKFPK